MTQLNPQFVDQLTVKLGHLEANTRIFNAMGAMAETSGHKPLADALYDIGFRSHATAREIRRLLREDRA